MSGDWVWLLVAALILVEAVRYAATGKASAFRPSGGSVAPLWIRLIVLVLALLAVWALVGRAL